MFQNLDEYYGFLDIQNDLLSDKNVRDGLIQLAARTEEEFSKKKVFYEMLLDDFKIVRNSFKKKTSCPDKDGLMQDYPNLNQFDDDLEYLTARAQEVLSTKLKAKYSHILWLGPRKNKNFAVDAIDNYLIFLKDTTFDPEDTDRSNVFCILVENLFLLSQHASYKKDLVLEHIKEFIGTGKISLYEQYTLMSFIAENGKKINPILTFFADYCIEATGKGDFSDFLREYLELQVVLSQKIGRSTAPFYNRLAEHYLEEAARHKGSFAAHNFLLKAAHNYKKAGNREKSEVIMVEMQKAKSSINLKALNVEYSDKESASFYDTVEKVIEAVMAEGSADEIYNYLIYAPYIIPKAEELDKYSDLEIMKLFSVTKFDQNSNISSDSKGFFNNYDLAIRCMTLPHLEILFQKSFASGRLTFESMSDFILNKTWYGQDDELVKSNGTVMLFRWANHLLPAMQSFFDQMEADFRTNRVNDQAYILSIDSLTLKFEGLLREFSRRIGAQTTELKDDSTEERIAFDKMLDNKKLVEIVPEDDIALFKYIFTSKGINLRNNVAHCFYMPMEYRIEWMRLLICAVLKLGRYRFNISEAS